MRCDKICISTDNSKLGVIPSVALPPIKTCIKNAPCARSCYARRYMVRFKNSRKAYDDNLKTLQSDSREYFNSLHKYFNCFNPAYFRIHPAGDFELSKTDKSINQDYLNSWFLFAEQFPRTKFLAFTKCYDLNYENTPDNVTVIFSAWFNFPMPETLPAGVRGIAWVQNAAGEETRIPAGALPCLGRCDSCFTCWNLKQGQSVVFDLH